MSMIRRPSSWLACSVAAEGQTHDGLYMALVLAADLARVDRPFPGDELAVLGGRVRRGREETLGVGREGQVPDPLLARRLALGLERPARRVE